MSQGQGVSRHRRYESQFVAAAYTSQCAKEFWLGSSASSAGGSDSCVDIFSGVHQAAALMIARRGLGLGLYRRFGNGPVASCVTSPVCCPDRREDLADGLGAGDACGDAAVSGSVVSSRKRDAHAVPVPRATASRNHPVMGFLLTRWGGAPVPIVLVDNG